MNSEKVNIRFLWWHLQVSNRCIPKVSFNKYHWDNRLPDGLFSVYTWMGKQKDTPNVIYKDKKL